MATNIIVMISDGIGYNGWLASDYYWHGATGEQVYQRPRPNGKEWLHVGMAHWALTFVDRNGMPVVQDGSGLPTGAVDIIRQGYDPATRWERLENALRFDFEPYGVPYTSYTDSAASATALFSGHTTTVARLNMNWNATERFTTIAEIAGDRGLATGIISTVQACHATPAGVVAHNRFRNHIDEIFVELLNSELAVIMGAGHPFYDDGNNRRAEPGYQHIGGEATWRDIMAMNEQDGFCFIETRRQFESLAEGAMPLPKRVVGIPQVGNTLQAYRDGNPVDCRNPSGMAFNENVPDLATMSLGALRVLNQRENGFFVLIEGGAVDWMNHVNNMPRMLEEQRDFNLAVQAVVDWVEANSSWDESLLIVTADHECGGIWGGGTYAAPDVVTNFHPNRHALNDFLAVQNRGQGKLPGYQYATQNHTNDLVPLWAIGKGSERFLDRTLMDAQAAQLWGGPYGWDGSFVHSTDVFRVMSAALAPVP